MRLWYAIVIVFTIVTWLSLGTAHTDMEGAWLYDKPVSQEIKAAMMKCGPNYHYRMLYDGTFQVNKHTGDDLDKRWERLRVMPEGK